MPRLDLLGSGLHEQSLISRFVSHSQGLEKYVGRKRLERGLDLVPHTIDIRSDTRVVFISDRPTWMNFARLDEFFDFGDGNFTRLRRIEVEILSRASKDEIALRVSLPRFHEGKIPYPQWNIFIHEPSKN